MSEDNTGWFHINETWDLFIAGKLEHVYVSFVNVKPATDGFTVDHYGIAGKKLRSHLLDADDIQDELGDREQCDRPVHI